MSDNLLSRFLRYVQVDTQSDETSKTFPSTPGQLVLLEMLKQELNELSAGRGDDQARLRHGHYSRQHPQVSRAGRSLSRPCRHHRLLRKNVKPIVHRKTTVASSIGDLGSVLFSCISYWQLG